MKRLIAASMCLVIAVMMPFAAAPARAAEMGIGVGDYWEYTMDTDIEGMSIEGSMKIKVSDTDTVDVGGEPTEVFVIKQTGTATISGGFDGFTMTGDMTITGSMLRLTSDYNLVAETLMMTMHMSAGTMTIDATMGTQGDYEPPLNDYVGDENLTVGYESTDNCTATQTSWYNILGSNDTDNYTDDMTLTMEVVAANVSVTTEAGTFSCYQVQVTSETNGGWDISTVNYYYSDKVGNYVKIEGGDSPTMMGLGDMELKSYSYGGSGGAGILSGPGLWIILGVIIAAVVLLGLAVLLMTRKRAQMPPPMMPPQQMAPPPPPAQ